jgi:hypothetical protein
MSRAAGGAAWMGGVEGRGSALRTACSCAVHARESAAAERASGFARLPEAMFSIQGINHHKQVPIWNLAVNCDQMKFVGEVEE